MATDQQIIAEIQRRAAAGLPLNSGANRGDWLYAGAAYHFGSWGKAVRAAGFPYDKIKIRPLTKAEVLCALRKLVRTGLPILARDNSKLRPAAVRHFGSWQEALLAAGADPTGGTKWTKVNVVQAIRRDIEEGLEVTSNAMRRRNENIYAAGRRRFGSWAAALDAAVPKRKRRSLRGASDGPVTPPPAASSLSPRLRS